MAIDAQTKQDLITMALMMKKARELEEAEKEAEKKRQMEEYKKTGIMPLDDIVMENGKIIRRNGKPIAE